MIKLSPSLLASDFTRLGQEASRMQEAGADMLHLDVMDGHFVPNISLGTPVIDSLRKTSDMFFDVHLMIERPLDYVDAFAKSADMLTFHLESASRIEDTIRRIKAKGIKCGLAIKPGTPASAATRFLPALDMVLVMTVEPGFGGQKFMEDMLEKIRELRLAARDTNPGLDIQVDGGIDLTTAPLAVSSGANVLVAGSSLFSAPDYTAAVRQLRQACNPAND